MTDIIKLTASDGSTVEFVKKDPMQGGTKDVYFSPDKSYVVGFYRKPQDANSRARLENIVGAYRDGIFNQVGGDYWKKQFCWPTKLVEWDGKLGVVSPAYQSKFFFENGIFKGKEKEGKWFASAKLRNRHLGEDQKGDWMQYVIMCLHISRSIRRLHAAGLAHSDLSYRNVLVDPQSASACIIDCDGLVVPQKFPPDVVGTPDFIAPEVNETIHLKLDDPKRILPSIYTDRHALAVLIYMYLLYRHPLRGGKVNDLDPTKDEELSMGKNALFVEHPKDKSNRPKVKDLTQYELPDCDVKKIPYSVCGPYLSALFERAFIDGLHNPESRPTAQDWETALLKTIDLMQPCTNSQCNHKWYVFDNKAKPKCPFCGTSFKGQLPILNFYYSPDGKGKYHPESYRLMVYDRQNLYIWHVNRFKSANEKLSAEEKKPVADFWFNGKNWILINRKLEHMYELVVGKKNKIEKGKGVILKDGTRILLSDENGGRLVSVQLVTN